MNWLSDNLTTIIVAIITSAVSFFSGMTYENKKKKQTLSQKSGSHSKQYQAGRDQSVNK